MSKNIDPAELLSELYGIPLRLAETAIQGLIAPDPDWIISFIKSYRNRFNQFVPREFRTEFSFQRPKSASTAPGRQKERELADESLKRVAAQLANLPDTERKAMEERVYREKPDIKPFIDGVRARGKDPWKGTMLPALASQILHR